MKKYISPTCPEMGMIETGESSEEMKALTAALTAERKGTLTRHEMRQNMERDANALRQARAWNGGKSFKPLTFTKKLAIRRQVNNIIKTK